MAWRYFSAKPLCPSHHRRGVGQGAPAISSSSSRPPCTGWITQVLYLRKLPHLEERVLEVRPTGLAGHRGNHCVGELPRSSGAAYISRQVLALRVHALHRVFPLLRRG